LLRPIEIESVVIADVLMEMIREVESWVRMEKQRLAAVLEVVVLFHLLVLSWVQKEARVVGQKKQ
jgi:acyl carrier protein phosphodiesterase